MVAFLYARFIWQGGKSARVVNSVLALKSYSDWKQTGGTGVWKFGGNLKPATSGKHFVRKNSDPFTGSLSRSLSTNEKSLNSISPDLDPNNKVRTLTVICICDWFVISECEEWPIFSHAPFQCSYSLSMLVRAVLLDKKPDEIPTVSSRTIVPWSNCLI